MCKKARAVRTDIISTCKLKTGHDQRFSLSHLSPAGGWKSGHQRFWKSSGDSEKMWGVHSDGVVHHVQFTRDLNYALLQYLRDPSPTQLPAASKGKQWKAIEMWHSNVLVHKLTYTSPQEFEVDDPKNHLRSSRDRFLERKGLVNQNFHEFCTKCSQFASKVIVDMVDTVATCTKPRGPNRSAVVSLNKKLGHEV